MIFKKFTTAAIAVLLCACLGAGCTNPDATAQPEVIRIGICLYKQDDTFIGTMLSNFEESARDQETNGNVKITMKALDAKGSQSLQNDQVDRLIAQEFDVICVNIVDRTAAAVIIDRAKSADIPLIFFNREPVEEDLERWEKVYYVGAVASESGILQGELVANYYESFPEKVDKNGDEKIQYVMLEGEPGHQDAMLRTEYSVKVVTARGIAVEKLATDSANWQRGQAASKMSQWLEHYGSDIEVVFSNNDDMALGAIDAYHAAKWYSLPIIVGVDATPPALAAINEGDLFATVRNDGVGQSNAMLELCMALSDSTGSIPMPALIDNRYIRLPYKVITAQSVQDSKADN